MALTVDSQNGDEDFDDDEVNDDNDAQEAAEPRKMYGTSSTPNFAQMMPSVGDPVFFTDSQNNDEYYVYDTDTPREAEDTSQPQYGSEVGDGWDQMEGAG